MPGQHRIKIPLLALTAAVASLATNPSADYYSILSISRTATQREIQKAYRRKAVQTHPDKMNGDRSEFDLVSEAYDVLSNEEKRQIYDRFGKRGLDGGMGAAAGGMGNPMEDIFRNFFGQGPSMNRGGPMRQQRNVRYRLEVTLEDLYNGTTRNIVLGIPGGKSKTLEVVITPGMKSRSQIVLHGEVDYIDPDATPGDLIFILEEMKHDRFSRKNCDLAMELEISLKEAICGFKRKIAHLDGRTVEVKLDQKSGNKILKTGDVMVARGEGMPKMHGRRDECGDLYVQFKVRVPRRIGSGMGEGGGLTDEERTELGRLLDKLEGVTDEKKKRKKKVNEGSTNDEDKIVRHDLEMASISEYGRYVEEDPNDGDDHLHHDGVEDGFHHPFFSARQFFSSSHGPRSFTQRSGFFSSDGNGDHDVQCQQM